MGAIGRVRVATVLNWDAQVPQLLAAYAKALGADAGAADRLPHDLPTQRAAGWLAPGPLAPTAQPPSLKLEPAEQGVPQPR